MGESPIGMNLWSDVSPSDGSFHGSFVWLNFSHGSWLNYWIPHVMIFLLVNPFDGTLVWWIPHVMKSLSQKYSVGSIFHLNDPSDRLIFWQIQTHLTDPLPDRWLFDRYTSHGSLFEWVSIRRIPSSRVLLWTDFSTHGSLISQIPSAAMVGEKCDHVVTFVASREGITFRPVLTRTICGHVFEFSVRKIFLWERREKEAIILRRRRNAIEFSNYCFC